MITCIWAYTSSINLFPQAQGGGYHRSGGGRRLSSCLPVQSSQRENMAGITSSISLAFPTQSPPHTGHLIHHSPRLVLPTFPKVSRTQSLLNVHPRVHRKARNKAFPMLKRMNHQDTKPHRIDKKACASGPDAIRTHDRPVMSRALSPD
jgi:hypothetical protein